MVITMGPVTEEMSTWSTVKLEWAGDEVTNAYAVAYIQLEHQGEKINVVDLFLAVAQQWRHFLDKEFLWVEQPPEWED